MTVGPFSTTRNPLTLRQRTQKRNTVFNKCGTFLVKSDQSKHKKTHAKENIFECYKYGYAVSKNTLLDIRKLCERDCTHVLNVGEPAVDVSPRSPSENTHGEKSYRCNKCKRTLYHKPNFLLHQKTHKG